jgi:hypothetical protein
LTPRHGAIHNSFIEQPPTRFIDRARDRAARRRRVYLAALVLALAAALGAAVLVADPFGSQTKQASAHKRVRCARLITLAPSTGASSATLVVTFGAPPGCPQLRAHAPVRLTLAGHGKLPRIIRSSSP